MSSRPNHALTCLVTVAIPGKLFPTRSLNGVPASSANLRFSMLALVQMRMLDGRLRVARTRLPIFQRGTSVVRECRPSVPGCVRKATARKPRRAAAGADRGRGQTSASPENATLRMMRARPGPWRRRSSRIVARKTGARSTGSRRWRRPTPVTVPSADPEASRVPSGLHAQEVTKLRCPLRVRRHRPPTASHTFTVRSDDPKASRVPSGLQTQAHTTPA